MKDWVVGLVLFIAVLIIGLVAAPKIGVSWDEPDNIHAGGVYAKFFTHNLDPNILLDRNASASVWYDKIFTQEPSLSRYPPVPIFVGVGVVKIWEVLKATPATAREIIASFHLASSLFLGLFIVSMYVLLRKLTVPMVYALGAAILAGLHPTIFGYGLSNIKDSALLSLFTLSLTLLVISTLKRSKGLFLAGAFVWGLSLATKINAIYVPVIWLGWSWLYAACSGLGAVKSLRGKLKHLSKLLVKKLGEALLLGVIGLTVMVIVWPYLWYDPVGRILEVLRYFTTVGTGYKVFWNKELYMVGAGQALPWYPLEHALVGTPVTYLCLALVGLIGHCVWLVKGKKAHRFTQEQESLTGQAEIQATVQVNFWKRLIGKLENQKVKPVEFTRQHVFSVLSLLVIWLVLPLIRTLSPTASFYDGMRHFLEVLPPVLMLVGFGLVAIYRFFMMFAVNQSHKLAALVLVLVLSHILFVSLHLFPFGTGYVNFLAKNPNTTLERDFGGLAIKEGVELAHKLKGGSMAVFVPIAGHLSWYWLESGDLYVYSVEQADVLILINKSSHVSKTHLDTLVSGMFDLKGTIRRGRDEFAWVYLRK